jgi:glycosyltransferase involved in cell wall biosynthesis
VLVENAIDCAVAFPPENRQPGTIQDGPKKRPRIVTVGGIRVQKNPRLFAEIARSFEREDVDFLWIGDGDASLKRTLEDAGVRVTGWLTRADAIDAVAHADIYLSTASWEGMPVSLIEAMALGTPVVASECAGNIDTVHHDSTGVLYRTAPQATALISRILRDDGFRKNLSRRAQQEASSRFSEDRFFANMVRLYSVQLNRIRKAHPVLSD